MLNLISILQQGLPLVNVITLLLLHPLKRNPVQSWSFESESIIRIGRSTDNHVILYSAVVSRHHVELRQTSTGWEIVNLGTNGTYLDGKRITKVPIVDGAIIRLARSGPNIQIRLGAEALKELPENLSSDTPGAKRVDHHATVTEVTDSYQAEKERSTNLDAEEDPDSEGPPTGTIPVPPHLRLPDDEDPFPTSSADGVRSSIGVASRPLSASDPSGVERRENAEFSSPMSGMNPGAFVYSSSSSKSADQPFREVGPYEILGVLGQGEIGITYDADRDGQALVLKSLNAKWSNHPKAKAALEVEAEVLNQLDNPHVPNLVDFFSIDGQPYLVMEKIKGRSLAHRVVTTGAMSLQQTITWMLKICDILSYLHQFVPPVLHRNIEPANLMCRESSDDIVLIGFGAVKALVLERKGWVGSNGYAAPNQLSVSATPQVDLYSLGPTMAYLLTGKNPVSFCKRDENNPYQFMADAVSGISDDVTALLKRLTHPNEEQHYSSVEAVVDALRTIAS